VGRGQGGAEVLQVCGAEGRHVLSCCRCVGRGQRGAEVLQVFGAEDREVLRFCRIVGQSAG